ncbi:MAG: DUF192 domain-containing protein [Candidatus Omnitrophica bacterium]|nr:DUF192 domain-containing protein [Candidatus Omnitrophota bacterium]
MNSSLVLIIFLGIVFCAPGASAATRTLEVCTEYKCFNSQVKSTEAERAQGLMWQDDLPDDQGMLFVFDVPGEYPFWMRNMKFPIDILWLDGEKRVVHMELSVPPCVKDPCPVYAPQSKALYVLEIQSGQVDASGIHIGDKLFWH